MDFNLVQAPGTFDVPNYSDNMPAPDNSSNSFDFNTIASGFSNIATPLLNFVEGMYAVSQHQPAPGTTGTNTQPQPQPAQQKSTPWLMYAAGAVVVLLVIGGTVYLLKKK